MATEPIVVECDRCAGRRWVPRWLSQSQFEWVECGCVEAPPPAPDGLVYDVKARSFKLMGE